ncbi:MAG: hypothetical protein HRU25_17965 [Psychrobium sp.]|nr:hypothetical protein [Psychrobium sp.]
MNIKNKLMASRLIKLSIASLFGLMLSACGDTDSKKMPEEVATDFINAIYNSKDIKTIKFNSSDKVQDLIKHYRSVKMIQRHVMDLSLDSANVEINDVGGDFFRKSKKDTKIEVHIRGKFDGGFKADDRILTMTWQDKRWKVKKISK